MVLTKFDKDAFFNHLDGDLELGSEILLVYLEDAPARFVSLSNAFDSRDMDSVVKYSHALKGISSTIRAESLAQVAARIEKFARNDKFDDAYSLLPILNQELDSVVKEVRSFLETGV